MSGSLRAWDCANPLLCALRDLILTSSHSKTQYIFNIQDNVVFPPSVQSKSKSIQLCGPCIKLGPYNPHFGPKVGRNRHISHLCNHKLVYFVLSDWHCGYRPTILSGKES